MSERIIYGLEAGGGNPVAIPSLLGAIAKGDTFRESAIRASMSGWRERVGVRPYRDSPAKQELIVLTSEIRAAHPGISRADAVMKLEARNPALLRRVEKEIENEDVERRAVKTTQEGNTMDPEINQIAEVTGIPVPQVAEIMHAEPTQGPSEVLRRLAALAQLGRNVAVDIIVEAAPNLFARYRKFAPYNPTIGPATPPHLDIPGRIPGRPHSETAGTAAKFLEAVAEAQKGSKLSFTDASVVVAKAQPELYRAYRAEQGLVIA